MTPFRNGLRITQKYGEDPSYYGQFGLAGHEGLDLVPKVFNGDNQVVCIEDGEVVRDIDDPVAGKAYGNHVVVLNRATGRAWWYCHLAQNYVEGKQQIKRGEVIGEMGSTGNTNGAHLHLGLRLANINGEAINLNNGYSGFVDPLPVLTKFNDDPVEKSMDEDTKRAVANLQFYRVDPSNKDGQEGNFEGFCNRLMDRDRRFSSLVADLSVANNVINELKASNDTLASKLAKVVENPEPTTPETAEKTATNYFANLIIKILRKLGL